MGLLKNPMGGTINIHHDSIIHTSQTLDYIIYTDGESILCLGSRLSDLTEMLCKPVTSNVRAILGKEIKEHNTLNHLTETHNLEDNVIYYILGYKDNDDPDNLICFVFENIPDCMEVQSCLCGVGLSMRKAYYDGVLGNEYL